MEMVKHLNLLMSRLDEQQRRWMAAMEAEKLGHGGIRQVQKITGLDINTIRRGQSRAKDVLGTSHQALWDSLPSVYRQCAKIYTDHWEAYRAVLPSTRHESVGKDSGLTSYIERLNNTFRQRISRLVRKTLSFSKKLENHIAAIWNFIHDYNYQIRVKMP